MKQFSRETKMKKIGVILADTQEYLPFIRFYSDMPSEEILVGANKCAVYKDTENDKEIYAIAKILNVPIEKLFETKE